MAEQSGWVETDSAAAGVATATRAVEANKQHVIYSVDASFSALEATYRLLQIKDGATIIWEGYVTNFKEVPFPKGLSLTRGNLAQAVLAAGASTGKVNLHGTTQG